MKPGEDGEHPTFCRLCEAYCGLIATVADGAIVKVAPDRENPHSQGHACVKGVSFSEVVYDPDRVLRPLRRTGAAGVFEPVSWDDALSDISERLGEILARHGGDAFALQSGNPVAFNTDFATGAPRFLEAIGARKRYNSGSQDQNSRLAANFLAFGTVAVNSFPDLVNCDFLIIMGANPLISNGSLLFAPRIRHDLDAIAERGRVVVVDPRRTETARRYEHLAVKPDGDAWLLLGMLRALVDADLVDRSDLDACVEGWNQLREYLLQVPVARAAERCGLEEGRIRELANSFAQTERAAVYGRLGLCRGKHGTLTNFLLTALNVVAGKFGRQGGTIFPVTMLAGTEIGSPGGYERRNSRVGDFPIVGGTMPSALLPYDLLQDGEDRVRAMFMFGANTLLSAPGATKLKEALKNLDLFVACDLYVNETNCHAHYILPGTSFFERADLPLYGISYSMMRPFLQYTDAVIERRADVRDEFEILAEIADRLGDDIRKPGRPLEAFDDLIRRGPAGDQYGKREGWSFSKLLENRHGVMVDGLELTAGWREKLGYPDKKIRVWHDLLETEMSALLHDDEPGRGGLQLIGRRDIRSMNSWLHNVEKLVRSQKPELIIHPDDAAALGICDHDTVLCNSRFGSVSLVASVSDEVRPGTVCYPHGWGHEGRGSWQIANATGGRNISGLFGHGYEAMEAIAGMTIMDGIPVSVTKP